MVWFLAPLIGALGGAGTATLAAGAVAAGASIYSNNQANKANAATNAQNIAAQNAANTQNVEFQREVNAQNRAWNLEDAASERAWQLDQLTNNLSRLKDAANLAGYHPLTALGATGGGPSFTGGGGGGASAVAPSVAPALASFNVAAGQGLRDVSDIITNTVGSINAGIEHKERLAAIADDKKRSGVADVKISSTLPSRPKISGPSGARSVGVGISPLGRQPDAGYEMKTGNIRDDVMTDGGNVHVPIGPDFDELLSGWAINEYGKAKWRDKTRLLDKSLMGAPPQRHSFQLTPTKSVPVPYSGTRPMPRQKWSRRFGAPLSYDN